MASSSGHKYTNRLALEKSPYLLQHAHNPVDWYPWGEEAIQQAKAENKLIFLSIGYSTCHWCHVMAKESFECEETAEIMNGYFINVKVDREERPDIDKIYMNFLIMIKGAGGWPLSVWLTPDLGPITGGTYYPIKDRWGVMGFQSVLHKVAGLWGVHGDSLCKTGKNIIETMQVATTTQPADVIIESLAVETKFRQGLKYYKRNMDDWGGFGREPKFPEVSKINLTLHAHIHDPESNILSAALHTLKKINEGGIHDHIFGGFARYSVDRKWHVPHFEKMVYDQAQLIMAYSNAYKLTKDNRYLDICDKIFNYLCKDLRHPLGGFFSGEDADSYPTFADNEKIEGAFYAWTWCQIKDAFQENASKFTIQNPFELYSYFYSLEETGNVDPASDVHGHLLGKNILTIRTTLECTSRKFSLSIDEIKAALKTGNEILHEIRNLRPRPQLDTKILTSWNGLVLSGLSKLACVTDAPRRAEYLDTAKQLVNFIRANNYNEETKKLHRSCYGEGVDSDVVTVLSDRVPGFLDDYSFLIKGLIDYYIASMDITALHWANELQTTQDNLFWDPEYHGYFYSEADSVNVVVRMKDEHDGAEPCGNSVAAHNLVLLSEYFGNKTYKETAEQLFYFYAKTNLFAVALPHMMSGLLIFDKGITTIVIVGPDDDTTKQLLDIVRSFYIPGLVLVHSVPGKDEHLTKKSFGKYSMIDDKSTVFLCHGWTCFPPIKNANELTDTLSNNFASK